MFFVFFLPFITVSCPGSADVSLSGIELSMGKTFQDVSVREGASKGEFNPELLAVAALICIGVGFLFALPRGGYAEAFCAIVSLLGIALLLGLKYKLEGDVRHANAEALGTIGLKFEFGYWMALGSFGVSFLLSLIPSHPRRARDG